MPSEERSEQYTWIRVSDSFGAIPVQSGPLFVYATKRLQIYVRKELTKNVHANSIENIASFYIIALFISVCTNSLLGILLSNTRIKIKVTLYNHYYVHVA